jgi:hypothetical protein
MVALIFLCLNLVTSLFKSKSRLEAENAARRRQLIILAGAVHHITSRNQHGHARDVNQEADNTATSSPALSLIKTSISGFSKLNSGDLGRQTSFPFPSACGARLEPDRSGLNICQSPRGTIHGEDRRKLVARRPTCRPPTASSTTPTASCSCAAT